MPDISRHILAVRMAGEIFLLASILLMAGPISANADGMENRWTSKYGPIAVLPIVNLSGIPAPLKEIRDALIAELTYRDIAVLDDQSLETFMARHRLRDSSAIDNDLAAAFHKETPARWVLITTLEFYRESFPPKVALSSRLVRAGEKATIEWMDGAGLQGDQSPGFFDRGMIRDFRSLLTKALRQISGSLADHLAGFSRQNSPVSSKYEPKVFYQAAAEFPAERPMIIAIMPFLNKADRKYGAAILAEHILKSSFQSPRIRVLEPGTIRQALYKYRMIMPSGMSEADAELILSEIPEADLLITGIVEEYYDSQSANDFPRVDFYLLAINRKGKLVWNSRSFNRGDEGVWFFDVGSVKSAYTLTDRMVRAAMEKMLHPDLAGEGRRKIQ